MLSYSICVIPMADLPLTTTKLLDRLRACAAGGVSVDADTAWSEIDARYRPVLLGFTRSLGLSQSDAEDAAQWALAELSRALSQDQYERGKGRLRSWVMGIARHRVQMTKRAAARRRESPVSDPTPLIETPDDATLSGIWDREMERAIFAEAWRLVQPRFAPATLRAFELVAMRESPVEAAAHECGMSVESVYVAKSRVTKALKEFATELASRYAEDQ
jgi:RNA polymerase sigma-70 factor (ECF subfamily)